MSIHLDPTNLTALARAGHHGAKVLLAHAFDDHAHRFEGWHITETPALAWRAAVVDPERLRIHVGELAQLHYALDLVAVRQRAAGEGGTIVREELADVVGWLATPYAARLEQARTRHGMAVLRITAVDNLSPILRRFGANLAHAGA